MSPRPILLIVEDDWTLRELYRLALSLSDFTVHACEDGLQALHYLEQERPDLIILDLNLPRVPGTMVFEELRAHSETANIPIIVVTGMYSVPQMPGALVLRKPVSAEELTRTVLRVLERRRRDWLFVSGSRSVRIVRIEEGGEQVRLIVCGPGNATEVYWDGDAQSALWRQEAIEQGLVAQGYRLLPSDRRTGRDRRALPRDTPERRRQADALLEPGV
jgi:DNA-binding response OmpR family regulator